MTNLTLSGDYTDFSDDSGPLGITVVSYTSLGGFSGLGKLELQARELIDVDNRRVEYFLVASVKPSDEYAREGRVVISYEDVIRTCAAIDRLKLAHSGITKFDTFEVSFETTSKFSICVFKQTRGGLGVSISADGASMFINDTRKLDELRAVLQMGLAYIDQNRIPGH